MLDPEVLDELAAHPERNAPEVNLALAEQGHAAVLVALASSPATQAQALGVIERRVVEDGHVLAAADEDAEDEGRVPVLLELDQLVMGHPNSPDGARDAVLGRHADDAWFVLAAVVHPRATVAALERGAAWPARHPVLDRSWIAAAAPGVLPPLVAEAWSQDPRVELREAAARLTQDGTVLAALARDPLRAVRRAVASNPNAAAAREELAAADPACEVRARAAGAIGAHGATAIDSARFAAAFRAMQRGGVLAPDVAEALSSAEHLDEEGAELAARVLPRPSVVRLIREGLPRDPASVGLAVGIALRNEDSEEERRELVTDACKALSSASERYGSLTGKARFAAWIGDGIAQRGRLDHARFLEEVSNGVIGGETSVLARSVAASPVLLADLCRAAGSATRVPPALLPLAWHAPAIDDALIVGMAQRLAKQRTRGQDLPEDELDLDPAARSLEVLEKVALAATRNATLAPRTALTAVALDARRVRYVLTALPTWRGRLGGAMLGRVLRQNAGALAAARSEARRRSAIEESWTARVLSDVEAAVAIGVGHFTAAALVERIKNGRHKLGDGTAMAAGAEARAALEGAESIAPLLRWATQNRSGDGAALALWLLLERYDRERPAGMLASAIDSLAVKHASGQTGISETASEALATLERRYPGRLEQVFPQTPRGKATLASALARAYRAVGGLRDERG